MLYRYVFLSSEAASHKAVEYLDLIIRKAKHRRCFVLGVIDALVCGVYSYPLLCRNGKGAFWFQESVFCMWSGEDCGICEVGFSYGFLCVSS